MDGSNLKTFVFIEPQRNYRSFSPTNIKGVSYNLEILW